MNWYVRNAEGEIGPLPPETLIEWAREARMLADHWVRPDLPGADWRPAGDYPELGLFWQIGFPDEASSLPVHGDTLATGLQSGDFQPDWTVTDTRTGDTYQLVDVVCAALFELVRELRAAAGAASAQAPSAAAPSSPTEWQGLVRELDYYKKEESKLRKFMEDEQVRSRHREEQLAVMTERFRTNERDYADRLSLLNQTRERMEAEMRSMRESMRDGAPESQVVSLRELALTNQELGRELSLLREMMVEHDRRLESITQERQETERDARERVRKLEEMLAVERLEASKARDQAARLGHKHREMLGAYRELSDRLIHMRNEALRGSAKPGDAEEPGGEPIPANRPAAEASRVRLR